MVWPMAAGSVSLVGDIVVIGGRFVLGQMVAGELINIPPLHVAMLRRSWWLARFSWRGTGHRTLNSLTTNWCCWSISKR